MNTDCLHIEAHEEVWPLARPFRISRGSRTEARCIVVTISDGQHTGRGEATPVRRYGQTSDSVVGQIEAIKSAGPLNRELLQSLLPPGAARNAIDCALWDLEAKRTGRRAWDLADISIAPLVTTAFTISLDTPEVVADAARASANAPILKIKLGGDDLDVARVEAVRRAAPRARLFVDANESWTAQHYRNSASRLASVGVELIEQPFPADDDEVLESLDRPVPVCADESCHTAADVAQVERRYDVANIKLDKTGGLTEALRLVGAARAANLKIFVGCMACTSLGIAPARLLASMADYVDLDGPLLLSRDREHGLIYRDGTIALPSRELWG